MAHAPTLEALFPKVQVRDADHTDPKAVIAMMAPAVMKIARRSRRPSSWELDDMVQVGLTAILVSLHSFDPAKGKLFTWAYEVARQRMWDVAYYNQGPVCVSRQTAQRARASGEAPPRATDDFDEELDFGRYCAPLGWSAADMENRVELSQKLRKVPERTLKVHMSLVAGFSGPEIAADMGVDRTRIEQIQKQDPTKKPSNRAVTCTRYLEAKKLVDSGVPAAEAIKRTGAVPASVYRYVRRNK